MKERRELKALKALKAFHLLLIGSLDTRPAFGRTHTTLATRRGRGHLGDLGAQVLVLLRVLQEVDKLQDLQLGLLAAGHVAELDLDVVLHHLGRGLAHAEGATPAAAGAAAHGPPPQREEQEADEQHGGDQAEQEGAADTEEGGSEGGSKVAEGGPTGKNGDTHPSLSLL